MEHRPRSGRQTDIADAILRVAGREGIGALTMERLGREVGVTSGALFRHFPSRTAMLNEAAQRAAALLDTTFPPTDLPPLERLRQFLMARSRLAAAHPGIPQLVFSEQFGKALPPRGGRAVRAVVLRTRDFVVEALREAGARGEVRRDVPAEELALTVMGAIFARALFAALADDGRAKSQPDAEAAWSHVLCLVRPPETAAVSSSTTEGVRS
jgi:AcrR family transcriptional regulator